MIEDQRPISGAGTGSDCEAPESTSSNVVRITEYVTSRTYVSSNKSGVNNRPASAAQCDDQEEIDRPAEEDEAEAVEVDASDTQSNRSVRRHRAGSGSGGFSGIDTKPRTSDYESSDSPNSSDHCDEVSAGNSRSSAVEDDHHQIIIRTEMEELDCSYPIPSSAELDDGGQFDADPVGNENILFLWLDK